MKPGWAVGPDGIPMEIWNCLGEEGLEFPTILFNTLLKTTKMPHECRFNIVISLYKNNGNIQNCNNYTSIKFLIHTMKL